jgi:hypothetical protein
MKTPMLVLAIMVIGGSLSVAMAETKAERAAQAPVKIVQGTLKEVDVKGKTVTVEIVQGQAVKLKATDQVLDQLDRVGKKAERVELRLSKEDVVQTVAVGTGP